MDKLSKCGANYVPLSPVTFLERAATVYADRTSVIYEGTHFTWKQTYDRCCRLASSLRSLNVTKNDVVSVLAPNVPALYEMHFAVPMAGAVLNTINTRLDFNNVVTILRHSEAKVFFVDYQYIKLAGDALKCLAGDKSVAAYASLPLVVVIDDVHAPTGVRLGQLEYEELVQRGNPRYVPDVLDDEWDPIALNYTSGTTSAPKGVVYSHRGAYLSTLSLLLQWEVGTEPVYMWSLPMFHCNGWTFTWGMAARGGTNVCIRSTSAAEMYRAISNHSVTHMCCAPVVFNMILEAKPTERCPITPPIQVLTGGAPPPAPLLEKMEQLGFHVTHAYGLTEATGPAMVCEWQARWDQLPRADQARLKARQGISVLTLAGADVKDPITMKSVARDGQSVGEIVLRGSSIMKGYYKDPTATSEAFKGGWFHTGDVGVVHPDGYVAIKDRSKDVIISGGENISSVEVETVLYSHPMVSEAAVVAMPHPRWGESPCAFLALKKEHLKGDRVKIDEEKIIRHCRDNLPGFMVPKRIVFLEELPKTSTGKILKFQLREVAKTLPSTDKPFQKLPTKSSRPTTSSNLRLDPHEPQVLAQSRL
ncbi:trans-cinnamate:CoA ligase, peroxisomal-like [Magnolia sinica]|uniref:trans-cinnamate:CoA ligase, peroxisomal-like n=1 Tax=Magnolia sinica TaxID=86752 RepID=UPI00265918B6|nr:trans-cinnamate:CoA ligase, peroxisomal-like [Magnolia sinica]